MGTEPVRAGVGTALLREFVWQVIHLLAKARPSAASAQRTPTAGTFRTTGNHPPVHSVLRRACAQAFRFLAQAPCAGPPENLIFVQAGQLGGRQKDQASGG